MSASEGNEIQVSFSDRRQPFENAVSGHGGHYEKVDGPAAGLEYNLCPAVRVFRRPDAGGISTPVRSKPENAVDNYPHRRYVER